MLPPRVPVPVVLLGRLAVDNRQKGRGLGKRRRRGSMRGTGSCRSWTTRGICTCPWRPSRRWAWTSLAATQTIRS